jgi:hypothetical protein
MVKDFFIRFLLPSEIESARRSNVLIGQQTQAEHQPPAQAEDEPAAQGRRGCGPLAFFAETVLTYPAEAAS